jgi:XapX domain-containing protein
MISYLVSLLMGTAIGAAHGLFQVRAPAPPLIALVGLLGMALGQQAKPSTRRDINSLQRPHRCGR